MAAWRMAFRDGKGGGSLWPDCRRLGIAVIQYGPADDIDFSSHTEGEPREVFRRLAPAQSASLKRLVYRMQEGDAIYVKEGPMIVGKGIVEGPYQFDYQNRLKGPKGDCWQHQRPVRWLPDFAPVRVQLGQQQAIAVVPLGENDLWRVEPTGGEESDIEGLRSEFRQLWSKRSRRLRDIAFRAANGVCCVCARDYSTVLGGLGTRVLQVHHRKQLSSRRAPTITTTSDLAVVCANCHLLLHLSVEKTLGVDELREMLQADGFLD
jgi:hypothetical protein